MENILKFIQNDSEKLMNVAIVGDAMIDQYYEVEVNRISPEFPIPIMKSESDSPKELPGGAANVAYQFRNFNFNASLYALLDMQAKAVLRGQEIFINRSVSIDGKIPRKRRYYCGDFPYTRHDVESKNYGMSDQSLQNHCTELFKELLTNQYDCVIFSDYDKGVFKNFDSSILKQFPLTIVDPKTGDLNRWKGCTVFKPNESEALRLSGKSTVDDAGWYLVEKLGSSVLITQAGNGVSVYEKGKDIVRIIPSRKFGEVESVIGAGDCFVCFLAMGLCRGMTVPEAADLAFHAGMLYVRNKHNKSLTYDDLYHVIDPCESKILNYPYAHMFKERNYKLVFTNGCFDLMHNGHVQSLKFAKSQGDKLIVAVNNDESVARLKSGRPIIGIMDRMRMLAACQYVDYVIPFNQDTPIELIKEIMPDVIVKGGEYQEKNVCGYGIVPKIICCPMVDGLSTTKIIEKIKGLS